MSAADHLQPHQFVTGQMRLTDLTPSVNMREIHDDPPSRTRGPLMVSHDAGVTAILNGNHRYRDAVEAGHREIAVNLRYQGQPPRIRNARPIESAQYWLSA
jgi:hypothetical protein